MVRAGRPSQQFLESATLRMQAARQLRPEAMAAAATLCAAVPAPSLCHALEGHVRSGCKALSPSQTVHISASFAKVGRRAPQMFAALASVAQSSLADFTHLQLVTLLSSFAITRNLEDELEGALLGELARVGPTVDSRQLLRAVQVVAEQPEPPRLVSLLVKETATRVDSLDDDAIVTLLEHVVGLGNVGVEVGDETLSGALLRRAEERVESFSEEALVKVLHACSLANIEPSSEFLHTVALRLAQRPKALSTWAFVTALWVYAMCNQPSSISDDLFPSFAAEVSSRVDHLQPHELASVMRSFSATDPALLSSDVYSSIAARVVATKEGSSAQSLVMLLRSLAVAGAYDAKVFAALESVVIANAADMTPHGIATIARAYAASKHDAPEVMATLAVQATDRAPTFAPPALASMLWSCYSAGAVPPSLLSAMARQTVRRAIDFDGRGLALTVEVFAKAGADEGSHPEVFEALGQQAILIADSFSHRDLVATVHSYAVASETEELRTLVPTVMALGQQALLMSERFSPHQLSTLLWAYARLRIYHCTDLMHALAQQVTLKAARFEPTELAVTLRGFSKLQYREPEVYTALAGQVIRKANCLSTRSIAEVAKAFAMSPVRQPEAFYSALADAASPRLPDFAPRELSALVFALATACDVASTIARPGGFLDAAASLIARRAPTFSCTADLALLLRAYAPLDTNFSRDVIAAVSPTLAKRAIELSPFEAAALLSALADSPAATVLRTELPEALLQRVVAAADRLSPRAVALLLSASGKLPEQLATPLLIALRPSVMKHAGAFDLEELRLARAVYRNAALPNDVDDSIGLVSLLEEQLAQLHLSLCQ